MTTQPATSEPSRTLTWNMDNHPTSVTSGGTTTETYRYDADGERLLRTSGGVGTYYLGGLYEEDAPSGTNRTLYQFNGQIVSQRTVDNSTPTPTPTNTPAQTSTSTNSPISTSTPTRASTPTSTSTPKNTPTSTATPTTTPSCPLSSALFYPHYTDIPPVNDGYQMNSSAPSTLGLSVTMGSGKGVNSLSWYSATEPNTNFTSGDYTFYVQVATCATASDPDRVTYKLEYTDPDGSNPVLIGSITQSHWNAGACGGGGGGAQGYTVSIAPAHGQVHLIGKRLRLTATLVNGSPTIYFGTGTYLDTPPYYVCTIGGGGTGGGGTLPGIEGGTQLGTLPGSGTQSGGTTSVPDSFTTGSKPLDPHDPQSPNVTNTVVYLHGDHLGSISVVTDQSGGVVSSQSYDPWGKVLSGGNVTQTKLNYTGQRLDDTGLLYYHARYYDPVLGRFTSPDSIVPGASSGAGGAGGTVGQEQNSKLTVDFHENGFLTSVRGENQQVLQKGFWYKGSQAASVGPANPQALNRYSYVLDNPLRYIDPSGHCLEQDDCTGKGAQSSGNNDDSSGGGNGGYSSDDAWWICTHVPFACNAGGSGGVANNEGPGKWESANEGMSERARAYQERITGRSGQVYRVRGVKFDGYKNGVLEDAKGPGYNNFLAKNGKFADWWANSSSGGRAMLDEARRQIEAASGTSIEWHVAERESADAIRQFLADNGYGTIKVVYDP